MNITSRRSGFTLVELLIVIVIIAILAAITLVLFNGAQGRAQASKAKADISELNKAIIAARIPNGNTLSQITGASPSIITSDACGSKPSGTDLAALPKTDPCWVRYKATLDAISVASGIDVRNLVDPWGRPYMIYEYEGRATPDACDQDLITMYSRSFVQWSGDYRYNVHPPTVMSNCDDSSSSGSGDI